MFNYDNPVMAFLRKVADMIVLGFYWIICSLPIITVGAATAAMYRTTAKVIKCDDGSITHDFFQSFKDNLKDGVKVTAIHLLFVLFLFVFFLGCAQMEKGSLVRRFYFAFGVALIIGFSAVSYYVYPLMSRFQFKPMQYFKAGIFLCCRHPLKTLLLLAAPSLLSIILYLTPVSLLLYPSVVAYSSVLILEPIFKEYMEANTSDESERDAWYWM